MQINWKQNIENHPQYDHLKTTNNNNVLPVNTLYKFVLSVRLYFVLLLWAEHFPSSFQPQDLWVAGLPLSFLFLRTWKSTPFALYTALPLQYFNHMQQFSIYLCSWLEQVSGAYIVARNDLIEVIIGEMMWNMGLPISCSVHSTRIQWRKFPLIPRSGKNHVAPEKQMCFL